MQAFTISVRVDVQLALYRPRWPSGTGKDRVTCRNGMINESGKSVKAMLIRRWNTPLEFKGTRLDPADRRPGRSFHYAMVSRDLVHVTTSLRRLSLLVET